MEHIPGYDEWKTTLAEEKPLEICDICGTALYEGDVIYTVNGENWCEDCLNDEFRRIL